MKKPEREDPYKNTPPPPVQRNILIVTSLSYGEQLAAMALGNEQFVLPVGNSLARSARYPLVQPGAQTRRSSGHVLFLSKSGAALENHFFFQKHSQANNLNDKICKILQNILRF